MTEQEEKRLLAGLANAEEGGQAAIRACGFFVSVVKEAGLWTEACTKEMAELRAGFVGRHVFSAPR